MTLPYNRALHPDDYAQLEPYVSDLDALERRMWGVRFRKDHTHRRWEYGQCLRQLVELFPGREASTIRILDTGSGASYFPLLLKVLGYDITVSDSMAFGDITQMLQDQCAHLGITIPLIVAPIEHLGLDDNLWDVTACISIIEHLTVEDFANGLRELYRVTKPGGYLFITSDFFRDEASALQSPDSGYQHNRFYPHTAQKMIDDVLDVEWVEGLDLTYREMPERDTVNGHSFVNFCLRKPD